ncbi:hypothetical protein AB1I82_27345 [Bacillus paranthracis]|uniref:hypothetical protein n=1 Tax=Bacillus paranthracis TaxID=2026186 RepID=UPI00355724FE
MEFLFNSKGQHIANLVNKQLHSPSGQNIGHYLENEKIFIDMRGRYLGEIMYKNRLLYNNYSPYKTINFGSYGNYGNVGNYGNPGNYGSIGIISGYKDIVF